MFSPFLHSGDQSGQQIRETHFPQKYWPSRYWAWEGQKSQKLGRLISPDRTRRYQDDKWDVSIWKEEMFCTLLVICAADWGPVSGRPVTGTAPMCLLLHGGTWLYHPQPIVASNYKVFTPRLQFRTKLTHFTRKSIFNPFSTQQMLASTWPPGGVTTFCITNLLLLGAIIVLLPIIHVNY